MTEPTFLLSSEASNDLLAIGNYIAQEGGHLRALSVIERIARSLATIAYSPNIGRVRTDLDGSPNLFPVPPWIILYEPAQDLSSVLILRIYDGRRDLKNLLREYKRPRRS